jgi:hypothetical protein
MTFGLRKLLTAALLFVPAFGQVTYKAARSVGTITYAAQAQGAAGPGENAYCPPGAGELTEGTPTWGTADGAAQLPQRCMNTALSSTPSGSHIGGGAATTYTPVDTAALNSVLATLQCGDTIVLTAGNTYTGTFTFPAPACDGGHWITVKSSGVSDGSFPAEGARGSPCIAGVTNDATHGRNNPGYPDYPCPSYPAVLAATILTGSTNQPAIEFASGANHYRFIGIEVTKVAETKLGAGIIDLSPDAVTMGANHIIFDRCIIHGQPWTLSSSKNTETQAGVKAKNSQWIAVVNSWIYDTYCNSGCVDSQAYSAGSGLYQDGPHKLYNNLLASAGETWIFGGGGQGAGTPNTRDFEARGNYILKPLGWMVPIETCSLYNAVTPKNLGEYKNMTYALVEGNYAENSWQGCQSDQVGYAWLMNPGNQNNHQAMAVNFNGTNVATAADSHTFQHHNGSPDDAANCPPGGCVLEIADNTRSDNDADYIFCNGTNGCDQTGMNLNGSPATARLTSTVASGSAVSANACVPGDCPSCKVENVTYRYNEIYNTTNGFQINSGLSSHCHDEAAGLSKVSIHDNLLHGLSREMGNGSDPYQMSVCTAITSNTKRSINSLEIAHNTCAIESGNSTGFGGLGHQNDHTDNHYFSNFNLHDNVSPAPWIISRSSGSVVTKGIGGNSGLANTYAVDSCTTYYPNEAPNGFVVAGNLSSFTFSPSLASYMVTVSGQYAALSASTATSFTLQTAASVDAPIGVRDLNNCAWTFRGNLMGTSLAGSGKAYDPYPANNNTNCGVSGTASCILDGTAFTGIFSNWGTGRTGNFALTSATFLNSASDAGSRSSTGKNPGADLTTLGTLTSGIHGSVYYPALAVATTALPAATVGTAYQASLQTSGGASPFHSWWIETDATQCGGNCGTFPASAGIIVGRGGVVNGPFIVGTVSRASNVSTFVLQQTVMAGAPLVGQTITLSGFVNGTGSQANDGSFNGTCVISGIDGNSFSCSQSGVEVASHGPKDASVVTFAPVASGNFSFWVGARDGAFQAARGSVTLTIATQGAHSVDLNWNASASDGENGCCTYNIYRSTNSGNYGRATATAVSGTAFTDVSVSSGTTYYYVVTACNGVGESVYSNEAVALVP